MTDQYYPKTIKPSRGAPIRTIARIIAEVEWAPSGRNSGTWMRFTVWETRGGAYIAVTEGDVAGYPDKVDVTATVVEPHPDPVAMQVAVLNHFDWHDRAKALLKRELGWAPCIEVA
jgi:predicted phosphatase